ncbi:MAG: SURF1 family protein [Pseudomonadota bacterium]
MSGSRPPLSLDLEWRTTLFVLLLFPLLIALGFWQLSRADEKAAMELSWDIRQNQPPEALAGLFDQPAEALAYLPVVVTGEFLQDRHFLLDNRVRQGIFGYEVLSVMKLDATADLAIINRGWVPGDPARRELPVIPNVEGSVVLRGHVYVPPGDPYLLAEQELANEWPKLVQAVEMDKLSAALRPLETGAVFPYEVRSDDGQPGALSVEWQLINVSPVKHQAYAVQWFAMAAALLLLFVFRSSNLWHWLRPKKSQ